MLLAKISLVIALTALGYAQEASPPREYPVGATMLKLRANFSTIASLPSLEAEIKEVSKQTSDRIENEFQKMWEPLKTGWDKIWDARDRTQIHNDKPHMFTKEQQAEADAYNREGVLLDKEQHEAISEFEANPLREKLDNFLASPLITEAFRTTEQLLHPPVYFNKGLAWLQLKGLAEGTLDWDNRANFVSGEYAITIESMPLEIKNSPAALQARKGLVCIADNDYEAAKAWFEQALLKDPDNRSLKYMAEFCRSILSRRR
ncbi:MAG: hypothetical protein NTU60_09740 [Candidatus Aminicenantes bacterium]|nr:hypothetical protein [Candidatus Aminicenantes bacterium]